tara:strand:- start:26 stop:904 length:879 start_codon:yes stop_codon:yes gene_type:complete
LKILVFGAGGQLGKALLGSAGKAGHLAMGLSRANVDITDADAVSHVICSDVPEAVINAAAYNAVDAAEDNRGLAFRINSEGAGNIAHACNMVGVPICHLSSDYVFDGSSRTPYREDSPVSPLSVYGASKARGEDIVRNIANRHLIIRTSWVFGRFGNNFVKSILGRLGKADCLSVIDDQIGCPTSAEDLATALFKILTTAHKTEAWGTYHFCGLKAVTWFQFANAIAMAKRLHIPDMTEIVPTTTADYHQRAVRPTYSVLDCQSVIANFGINVPEWPTALANVVDYLVAGNR